MLCSVIIPLKAKVNLSHVEILSSYRAVNTLRLSYKNQCFRDIIAVCSEIHTKHISTLCGQNVELLNVKLAVHLVTAGLQRVKCLLYKPVS